MAGILADAGLEAIVAAASDAALAPDGWPDLLQRLAATFRSGFADVFARTEDRTRWRGLAYGLDVADYQDVFLGTWVKRNVWSARAPVRQAGEVLTTREIMPRDELVRTGMYNDYLAPRGLHEGLRLSLWAGQGWVQDISLLRPWSAGPFEGGELDLAGALLPHLRRSAAIARQVGAADGMARSSLAALDALRQAAFMLDGRGRVLHLNRGGEALAAAADTLLVRGGCLDAANPAQSPRLQRAIAAAAGSGGAPPIGADLALHHAERPSLPVMVVPVSAGNAWAALDAPAVLVLSPLRAPALSLAARYGLTPAEAALAARLAEGHTLVEAARLRGCTINTVRTHLARLMGKTDTQRQSALVRLLTLDGVA